MFEWKVARTQAHLHLNGNYTGISVSLTKCRPSDELLVRMSLPPLPTALKAERQAHRE